MPESPVWLIGMGRRLEAESVLQLMYGQVETTAPTYSLSPTASCPTTFSLPIAESSPRRHNTPTYSLSPTASCPTTFSLPIAESSSRRHNTLLNNTTIDPNQNNVFSKNGPSRKENQNNLDMDDSLPNNSDKHSVSQNSSCGNKCALFFIQVSMCSRQIIIALFLTTTQQFCGHSNILNFAGNIFAQVGLESASTTLIITIILGLVKFIITCCVIWKIDHFGRRPLLHFGMCTITLSLFMLFIAYGSINDDGDMSSWGKYIAILGIFGVVAGYAGSFGPLTWLLVSELFPSNIRGRALGGATICSHLSAALVTNTFLSWQSSMGSSVPFAIYCVLTALSMAFAYVAMPETGGKTFDEIANEMDQMRFWNICRRKSSISVIVPIESSAIIV